MKIEISDVDLGELEDFTSRFLEDINEGLESIYCRPLPTDIYAKALEYTLCAGGSGYLVFPVHDDLTDHRVLIEKVPQC